MFWCLWDLPTQCLNHLGKLRRNDLARLHNLCINKRKSHWNCMFASLWEQIWKNRISNGRSERNEQNPVTASENWKLRNYQIDRTVNHCVRPPWDISTELRVRCHIFMQFRTPECWVKIAKAIKWQTLNSWSALMCAPIGNLKKSLEFIQSGVYYTVKLGSARW